MKTIIKSLLIALGIILLLMVLFAGGYWMKMQSEVKLMAPLETKERVFGSDTIYSIRDSFVNMFLVKSLGMYIAIDAGNDKKNIEAELEKLKINPEKVVAIFLTHSDGDHVAAITLFKNAQLFFSRDEEPLTDGRVHRFFGFGNSLPTKVYTLLDDNQSVPVGNHSILCIATPGHTIGSMCYLVNGTFLFVGDALSLKNGKAAEFNRDFTDSPEKMRASMKKLATLKEPQYIFTAHYGMTGKK